MLRCDRSISRDRGVKGRSLRLCGEATRAVTAIVCLGGASPLHAASIPTPVYPLFSITQKTTNATTTDLQLVAQCFQFVHGSYTAPQIAKLHNYNPDFVVLKYVNHEQTTSSSDVPEAEADHRGELLYFKVAKLKWAIDATTTTFNLAQTGGAIVLKASTKAGDLSSSTNSSQSYVTWIRAGTEFMRIEAWDSDASQITVSRGFAATTATTHVANGSVFCPVYQEDNYPDGPSKQIRYHYDPAYPVRWDLSLQSALQHVADGYDGTWYDLLGCAPFKQADANGASISAWWDFNASANYVKDVYCEYTEAGVNFAQNQFKAQKGRWPILYANNIQSSEYEVGSGGEKLLIMPTAIKPRPMDGFCIESFAGSIAQSDYDAWAQGGPAKPPSKNALSKWKDNVQELMKSSQAGIRTCPMICNAGVKVNMYEECAQAEKDDFESWAYATYLMGVEMRDTSCTTPLGVPVFRLEGSARYAYLHPRYTWPIGEPAETKTYDLIDQYKPAGHSSYLRRFTNGLAIVNPASSADNGIALGRDYLDPETDQTTSTLDMAPHTGKVFLRTPPAMDVDAWRSYESERGFFH